MRRYDGPGKQWYLVTMRNLYGDSCVNVDKLSGQQLRCTPMKAKGSVWLETDLVQNGGVLPVHCSGQDLAGISAEF